MIVSSASSIEPHSNLSSCGVKDATYLFNSLVDTIYISLSVWMTLLSVLSMLSGGGDSGVQRNAGNANGAFQSDKLVAIDSGDVK